MILTASKDTKEVRVGRKKGLQGHFGSSAGGSSEEGQHSHKLRPCKLARTLIEE